MKRPKIAIKDHRKTFISMNVFQKTKANHLIIKRLAFIVILLIIF